MRLISCSKFLAKVGRAFHFIAHVMPPLKGEVAARSADGGVKKLNQSDILLTTCIDRIKGVIGLWHL